jgi:hypothetical protein
MPPDLSSPLLLLLLWLQRPVAQLAAYVAKLKQQLKDGGMLLAPVVSQRRKEQAGAAAAAAAAARAAAGQASDSEGDGSCSESDGGSEDEGCVSPRHAQLAEQVRRARLRLHMRKNAVMATALGRVPGLKVRALLSLLSRCACLLGVERVTAAFTRGPALCTALDVQQHHQHHYQQQQPNASLNACFCPLAAQGPSPRDSHHQHHQQQQHDHQQGAHGQCQRQNRLKVWRGLAYCKSRRQFTATVWVKEDRAAEALGANVVMFR